MVRGCGAIEGCIPGRDSGPPLGRASGLGRAADRPGHHPPPQGLQVVRAGRALTSEDASSIQERETDRRPGPMMPIGYRGAGLDLGVSGFRDPGRETQGLFQTQHRAVGVRCSTF